MKTARNSRLRAKRRTWRRSDRQLTYKLFFWLFLDVPLFYNLQWGSKGSFHLSLNCLMVFLSQSSYSRYLPTEYLLSSFLVHRKLPPRRTHESRKVNTSQGLQYHLVPEGKCQRILFKQWNIKKTNIKFIHQQHTDPAPLFHIRKRSNYRRS